MDYIYKAYILFTVKGDIDNIYISQLVGATLTFDLLFYSSSGNRQTASLVWNLLSIVIIYNMDSGESSLMHISMKHFW